MAQKKQDQEEDPYIDPKGKHPENAVYVARDKKSGAEVSFDQWGRRLDGIGNVVAESRQRAGDAGAKAIRPKAEPQAETPKPVAKSPSQWTTGPSGPMSTVPQRSTWDNSILPSTTPAAPAARSVPPGVLAPGGVDPATGQKVPTAFNGMLPSAPQPQEAPQMGPQVEPQWRTGWGADWMPQLEDFSPMQPKVNIPGFGQLPASVIPMQTGGLAETRPPWRVPQEDMPYPPTGDSLRYRQVRAYEPYQGVQVPVTNPLAIYGGGY